MRTSLFIAVAAAFALGACTASDTRAPSTDNAFDGTCVQCHLGLSSGHTHPNYKLRCIDCHGGNDQVAIPTDVVTSVTTGVDPTSAGKFRDPALVKQAHVSPKVPGLARFFFANGVDDDGDGQVDEVFQTDGSGSNATDLGENYEPGLHGEGPGEFVDSELNRDLNYTRFLNPGDLRVATIGCGSKNRAALDGGGGGGCHQETIDSVRRSIMVNQSAVTNGAYYGNESWRQEFLTGQTQSSMSTDPRAGAFGYQLDYDGADGCIDISAVGSDVPGGRAQPRFNSSACEAHATSLDPAIAAGAPGNAGLPAFEIAEGVIKPAPESSPGTTLVQTGAGQSRYPWGGTTIQDQTAERKQLAQIPNADVPGVPGVPDPVDLILRTFRAYYPLNYPGSVVNQNFTFGTSILPDIAHFKTNDPFGRAHSSGCTACHSQYNYDGSRDPTTVVDDNGSASQVVDPTTKHREFNAATDDIAQLDGQMTIIGRVEKAADQMALNRPQQNAYSANHVMSTAITTDTCGLCHGFVTRINYAYQGMAEEEQRDQLSRRKEVDFATPTGTNVRIVDSWVREEVIKGATQSDGAATVRLVQPTDGLNTIKAAKARDAALAKLGFVAGNGGCGQNTFTEDCNNNGELDHDLTLTHTNADGSTTTAKLDEDGMLTLPDGSSVAAGNGNGKLDLIDRLPRENSIDGRQMRYVYGGRNGSTRLMDIHFEKGMACIDCHFLQDVHGDGHVYSTNWDNIEIECEDCHGASKKATLITSGPTGGNDLTRATDANLVPYFTTSGGQITQHSRVNPNVSWVVPQTADQSSALAKEAHSTDHVGEPREGSTFDANGKLLTTKVECAACHSSWIHNCVGCHVNANVGDPQRLQVDASGALSKTPKENEIWFTNQQNEGHIDFQLLSLMRAPFVLGVSGSSEEGRLATFRSSMQAMVSVTGPDGNSIRDNLSFSTFQGTDGNSGRKNVATSGVAMNQTMPHTVRPTEARGCETCHKLIDSQGRVRNEHILAETYGLGTGAMDYVGDWGMAAGTGGLELYDYKQDGELAANIKGKSSRFPGIIVDAANVGTKRDAGNVEPVFDGTHGIATTSVATDIVLIRNFNPTPVGGANLGPSLNDLAVLAVDTGTTGRLVLSLISARGVPGLTRPPLADAANELVVDLPARPTALAHIGPDVSDPFVYVAMGTAGVAVVHIDHIPSLPEAQAGTATANQFTATVVKTVALPSNHTANALQLAGDLLYVGTTEGTVEVLDLTDPANPVAGSGTPATVGSPINGFSLAGFVLYAATPGGIAALQLDDPQNPAKVAGASSAIIVPGINANQLNASQGHLYVAAGSSGVFDIDVRTPAKPGTPVDLVAALAPGQPINAADVSVSTNPGQVWILVLDANGDLWGLKLDGKKSVRERCFPDPVAAGCTLDMVYLDATQSGRDPSFDPTTGTFDDPTTGSDGFGDVSSPQFFHATKKILTSGTRLARPEVWEAIGTLTGRRLRDSFMPGSGVLSLDVMETMRSFAVCETASGPSNEPGNLNALGYADAAFLAGGSCQPFGMSQHPKANKPHPTTKSVVEMPPPPGDGSATLRSPAEVFDSPARARP